MHKRLLLFLMLFGHTMTAQYFQHSYGWGPFNTAPSVGYSPQHVFGIFGSFSSSTSGQTDYVLLRTDSLGNFLDAHAFGSGGVESAQHVIALPDSGFLLTGFSNGFAPNNDYNAYLVRTSPSGDSLWTLSYGSSVWDFVYGSTLMNDGHYLLAGGSNQSISGSTAGWLSIISPGGLLVREKRIELPGYNVWLNSILQNSAGVIYASGYTESIINQHQAGCLFKIDGITLDTLWSFFADPSAGDSRFNGLTLAYDGSAVAAGFRIESGHSDKDIFVMNIDTAGALLWNRIYATAGEEFFNSITTCGDSLICAGMTNSFGGGQSDCYVVALDSAGYFLHGSTFGSAQDEIGNAIIPIDSKGFAVLGTTTSYGPGLQSMMLVTCDSLLNSSNSFIVSSPAPSSFASKVLSVYPNPASTGTVIRVNASGGEFISVNDSKGALIYTLETPQSTVDIPTQNWAPGLYTINIRFSDGTFAREKFLIIAAD